MHSVELTEEEIEEINHALNFTLGESQERNNDAVASIFKKLDKALENNQ